MTAPSYLTYTRPDGTPDRKVEEDFGRALERARKEGERLALQQLRLELMTDDEVEKFIKTGKPR